MNDWREQTHELKGYDVEGVLVFMLCDGRIAKILRATPDGALGAYILASPYRDFDDAVYARLLSGKE